MPGRIRSIKPELRELAAFACLTDGAVRLYVGAITIADDDGRFPAGASFLAGAIFFGRPRSPNVVGRFLTELEDAELIRRYEVKGSPFAEFVGWSDKGSPTYQYIKKPHPFRYPAPSTSTDLPRKHPPNPRPETPDLDLEHEREGNSDAPPSAPSARPEEEEAAQRVLESFRTVGARDFANAATARKLVIARLREGVQADELVAIVKCKAKDWSDDAALREQHCSPFVLFGEKHFARYLEEARGLLAREEARERRRREYWDDTPPPSPFGRASAMSAGAAGVQAPARKVSGNE